MAEMTEERLSELEAWFADKAFMGPQSKRYVRECLEEIQRLQGRVRELERPTAEREIFRAVHCIVCGRLFAFKDDDYARLICSEKQLKARVAELEVHERENRLSRVEAERRR